ncbi:hypothetical protein [Armatimonas sp.]|uniref:hypothetical protein n=1 Tax=Armatimonas sp. TaxID=1872638 RepID=UPI0037522D13
MVKDKKRIGVALLVGLVAFLITALVVLQSLPQILTGRTFYNGSTWMAMYRVNQRIQEYEKDHGKLPASLADLPLTKDENLDSWKRPLLYERHEGKAILTTLGRDGKLGGEGVDEDYTSETKHPPRPTVAQILQGFGHSWTDDYLRTCLAICALNGAFWFLSLILSTEEKSPKQREPIGRVLNYGGLMAIFALTVFGAVVMAALDVPTGH